MAPTASRVGFSEDHGKRTRTFPSTNNALPSTNNARASRQKSIVPQLDHGRLWSPVLSPHELKNGDSKNVLVTHIRRITMVRRVSIFEIWLISCEIFSHVLLCFCYCCCCCRDQSIFLSEEEVLCFIDCCVTFLRVVSEKTNGILSKLEIMTINPTIRHGERGGEMRQ